MSWRITKTLTGLISGLLLLAGVALPTAAEDETRAFEAAAAAHAGELLTGIGSHAEAGTRRLRIAVWPFRESRIPIDAGLANSFMDQLLSELLRLSDGGYEYIARDAIKTIIADMEETGSLYTQASQNAIAQLMKQAQDVDLLVEGRMRLEGRRLNLFFKAVSVEGTILAVSKERAVPLSPCQASATCPKYSIDQAVASATAYFAERLPDLQELYLSGVRYHDTGAQPPFGRYVQQRLADAFGEHVREGSVARDLQVREFDVESALEAGFRGISLEDRETAAVAAAARPTVALLEGSYWVFGESVDLRLLLHAAGGAKFTWRGRVHREGIEELGLAPQRDLSDLRENDGLGPIDFSLTSNRGPDPAFRIGDTLSLVMTSDRDAWVYCYYAQADGQVMQIFPNPKFWEVFDSPRILGGRIHQIPGPDTYPFELVVKEPKGLELVKCFATSRDVTAELPAGLQGREWRPLDERFLGEELSNTFRTLPDTAVTEASIAITVTPK